MPPCIENGCNRQTHCKNRCKLHYGRIWDRNHKELISANIKKHLFRMKRKVFGHYSNYKYECACCGENTVSFLTIDHIKGKKSMNHDNGMKGKRLYSWLIRNKFPDGFQVLCWNCNSGKSVNNGICPHKELTQSFYCPANSTFNHIIRQFPELY